MDSSGSMDLFFFVILGVSRLEQTREESEIICDYCRLLAGTVAFGMIVCGEPFLASTCRMSKLKEESGLSWGCNYACAGKHRSGCRLSF